VGVAVIQAPAPAGDKGVMALETVLLHKSGEWMSGTIQIPLGKADPQGFGSAMTYGRRYSLAAMVGVMAEDDDGEAAMGRGPSAPPRTGNGACCWPWPATAACACRARPGRSSGSTSIGTAAGC
jgi:hypothetical protein